MDLIWIVLQVFLGFAVAQNQTDVEVTLGQKVYLNCTTERPPFSWYMEIHSGFTACIVRVYSGTNKYCIEHMDSKYEAIKGNTLVINNITAADCRRYFCGKMRNDKIHFQNSFNVFTSEYRLCYIFSFWVVLSLKVHSGSQLAFPRHLVQMLLVKGQPNPKISHVLHL